MLDPAFAFQTAIYTTLTTSPDVFAAFGSSPVLVYDRVPMNPPFPFIQMSDAQVLPGVQFQFQGTSEIYSTIHVYSRAVGKLDIKLIAGAVRTALEKNLDVTGFIACTYEYMSTRYLTDPDGLTQHAVIEFCHTLTA